MASAPGNSKIMERRRTEAALEIAELTEMIEGLTKTLTFLKHRRTKAYKRFNAYGGLLRCQDGNQTIGISASSDWPNISQVGPKTHPPKSER